MTTQCCTTCGRDLPATTEYFALRQSSSKKILNRRCRECQRVYRRTYQQSPEYKAKHKAHLEQPEVKAHQKAYDNSPQRKAKRKQYRQTPGYRALIKIYRQSPEYKATARRYWQTPKMRAFVQVRNQAPEFKAYIKEWQQSPDGHSKSILRNQRRRARKRSLPNDYTVQEWQAANEYFNGCAYCGSQEDLTIDHYIPVSAADCPGTICANIVPACRSCNYSKQDRDAVAWINRKFGTERAADILTRILTYFASVSEESEGAKRSA